MKVIFLDIDGPIATRWSQMNTLLEVPYGHSHVPFDRQAVRALNFIIESTGAVIVLSSAWRCIYPFIELKEMFMNGGIHGLLLGKTPESKPLSVRGLEIQLYMSDLPFRDKIESFVIIDDDVHDILPYFPNNTLACYALDGITMEIANKAISILNGVTNDETKKERAVSKIS